MAKQSTRFLPKALIGMGAVTGLTAVTSTPARAETIDLVCKFETFEEHVYIDTNRQSVVVTGSDDKPNGPYAVSISDTFFRWNGRYLNGWDYRYTIDRVTGTTSITGAIVRAGDGVTQYSNHTGQCRRATQKF